MERSLDRITYLGHASLLLELGGVRLLTDPLLLNRVLFLYRRAPPVREENYRNIDAVLISHNHWDHLDLRSLRRLGKQIHLIVPRGVGTMLRQRGFGNVEELRVEESTQVGALRVRSTYARHIGGRALVSAATNAFGFVIEGRRSLYFPGDTGLFPAMGDLAPDLDLAFVPIAGWGPSLGDGHMDSMQAAEALALLRPRVAIPIHWGTYYPFGLLSMGNGGGREPATLFLCYAKQIAPDVEVRILPPGGTMGLDPD